MVEENFTPSRTASRKRRRAEKTAQDLAKIARNRVNFLFNRLINLIGFELF